MGCTKGSQTYYLQNQQWSNSLYEGETEIVTYVDPRDNISVDNITITRYEGATELYATYVDLQDKEGKYKLHGEFYKDGVGGIVGKVMKNEVECDLGLLGSSISMYENVSPTATTKSSGSLTVPQRSQWEILWYQHDYIAASQACMETSCAMLEEYYTGQHPAIWDVWVACGSGPANAYEAMDYFYSKGLTWIGVCKFWANTNTVNNCIAHVMTIIDMGRPMILEEKSESGNAHAVVVKGYNYETTDHRFYLNDPNTLTGSNYIWMYHYSYPSFNFEDNVVYWVGADDDHANGYTYLRQ